MVDTKKITSTRLASWQKKLGDAHATPVLLVGVGHDHASGRTVVVTTEDMPIGELKLFLQEAIRQLSGT